MKVATLNYRLSIGKIQIGKRYYLGLSLLKGIQE
jgi:hypothetical protein